MADLIFGCTGASADRFAVTPTLFVPAGHHRAVRRARARDRPALPDPHRAASPPVLRHRSGAAARPVRRHVPLGRHGQADPARHGHGDGPLVQRRDRDRPAGAVHLRPGGGLGPLPAGPGRRHDPAADAVQRHRLRRHRDGLLGRARAVERRGLLPDAGQHLARPRRRALPRQRVAALQPGDAGRGGRLQGAARPAHLGRHLERAAGRGRRRRRAAPASDPASDTAPDPDGPAEAQARRP